jgi:hypothetical protein
MMICTESEAHTKWCPKCNRGDWGEGNRCIASGCMWWVWHGQNFDFGKDPSKPRTRRGSCGAVGNNLEYVP